MPVESSQHRRRFLDRQPTKIPELDNAALLRIQRLEPRQRLIEDEGVSGINRRGRRCGIGVVDRDIRDASTALEPAVVAGVIHDDSPHQLRRDAEEMRAILPVNRPLPNELEIGLVDERRGLQRVIAPLARQVPRSQRVQFGVDKRDQPVERLRTAVLPLLKQARDIGSAALVFHSA